MALPTPPPPLSHGHIARLFRVGLGTIFLGYGSTDVWECVIVVIYVGLGHPMLVVQRCDVSDLCQDWVRYPMLVVQSDVMSDLTKS